MLDTKTETKETKTIKAAELVDSEPSTIFDVEQYLTALEQKALTGIDLSACKAIDSKKEPVPKATLAGHNDIVRAFARLSDGRLISCSNDNTIKLWDLKNQICVATLNGHSSSVCTIALLPDGRLISGAGSGDNTIKLWDLKSQTCIATLNGHSSYLHTLALLPDGRLISGSGDNTIKLWDLKSQTCIATLKGHSSGLNALALLPDGRLVSGSTDNTIKLWNLENQTCIATLNGHGGGVYALALLPDGRLISGSSDNTIKLWDLKNQICIATLNGHSGTVYAFTLLPDGRLISGSADNTIKLWDLKNQTCVATLSGHSGGVWAFALLPDGRLISGSDDKTIKLWSFLLRTLTLIDVTPLLKALKNDRTVQTLNLAHVALGDEAIPMLLEVLAENTTLTQLDLRDTGISAIGAQTLYQRLKDHPVRQSLFHEALTVPLLQEQQQQQKQQAKEISILKTQLQREMDALRNQFQQEIKNQHAAIDQISFFQAPSPHLWEEAVKERDLSKLQRLINNSTPDPTAVSFITVADELKSEQCEQLRKRQGIITLEHLTDDIDKTIAQLATQPPKRRLLQRLYDNIEQLLSLWQKGTLPTAPNQAFINQAVALLKPLWDEEKLPENVMEAVKQQLNLQRASIHSAWSSPKAADSKESKEHKATSIDNELETQVINRLWSQWKEREESDNPAAPQLTQNKQQLLMQRLQAGELPADFSEQVRDKLTEALMADFKKGRLHKALSSHISHLAKAAISKATGDLPVFDAFYQQALQTLWQQWIAKQLDVSVNDAFEQVLNLQLETTALPGTLRTELDRAAVELLVQQYKTGQLDPLLEVTLTAQTKSTFLKAKTRDSETEIALTQVLKDWQQQKLPSDASAFLFQATTTVWQKRLGELKTALHPHLEIARLRTEVQQLRAVISATPQQAELLARQSSLFRSSTAGSLPVASGAAESKIDTTKLSA